jgi:glycosyltransferase involved in cell wall biosynthesis
VDAVPRVLLCSQPTDGGVGRHIRDLALGLSGRGWEVIVCAPALPQGSAGAATLVETPMGRAVKPLADAATALRLARTIRAMRPDIVHAHSSKAGALARVARLAAPSVPLVYTPHGYAFAGHFSGGAERGAYRTIERALTPLASRVVCVCEAEARLARSVGGRDRVRVVHNGIAAPTAGPTDPRVEALAARGPVIGALTLLRPGKGLETLIDAIPSVLEAHPSAQVAICGGGPDLDALLARARTVGVADAVHFLGPVADPIPALRGLDVFVHPSWAESFPYVILEAMSLGLPVVASDVGGVGEAIVDGDSGLLVPRADAAALAGALRALLDDPARRAAIGAAAGARALGVFKLEAMIDDLIEVYDELMAPCPGRDADVAPLTGSSPGGPVAPTYDRPVP